MIKRDLKICFLGGTHAAIYLAIGARSRGHETVSRPQDADLVFVSMDTPTYANGRRDMGPVVKLIEATDDLKTTVVVTSACEPGFIRSLRRPRLIHQSETLRIKDAEERARNPKMMIVGTDHPAMALPAVYLAYLMSFRCPILRMTWEEAEFAKVAINSFLAAQVDTTNRLATAAAQCGAQWAVIAEVLRFDARIGPHCYLSPGRWQNSPHLLRDAVTLAHIMGES